MEDEMARNSLLLDQAVESGEKKKKSQKKLILGLAMLGVIPVIGSTLAASITIGSGNIEFGQGQRAVVACDSSVTIAVASAYNNALNSSAGAFELDTITLSGLDTTACAAKSFTLTARKSDGTAVTNGVVTFTLPAASATSITTQSGATSSSWTANATSSSITFTLSGSAAAADVDKVTLETS
jgi:hypothetical protein